MNHDYLVDYVLRRPNWLARSGIYCSAQLLGLARRRLVRLRYNKANNQILVYLPEVSAEATLIGDKILLAKLFAGSKTRVQLGPYRNAKQNPLCYIAARNALKANDWLEEEDRATYNKRRLTWSVGLIVSVVASVIALGVLSGLGGRLVLQTIMWMTIAAMVPIIRHRRQWRVTTRGKRQRDLLAIDWARIETRAKLNSDEALMLGREDFDLGLVEAGGSLDDGDREAIRDILKTAFSVRSVAGLRR